MWIATTLGFFSCTRSTEEPDKMQIRARQKGDLLGLINVLGVCAELIKTPDADYRWRVIVDVPQFLNIMEELARRVTYTNFKDTVHHTPGQEDKAGPYMRIWATMKGLQDREDALTEEQEPALFRADYFTKAAPEGEAFYPEHNETREDAEDPDAFTPTPPEPEVAAKALENPVKNAKGKKKTKTREKLEQLTGDKPAAPATEPGYFEQHPQRAERYTGKKAKGTKKGGN